jgi:hypothetical protein
MVSVIPLMTTGEAINSGSRECLPEMDAVGGAGHMGTLRTTAGSIGCIGRPTEVNIARRADFRINKITHGSNTLR